MNSGNEDASSFKDMVAKSYKGARLLDVCEGAMWLTKVSSSFSSIDL